MGRRRAERVVTFSLAMLIWSPVFAPIYALLGSARCGLVILAAGVACSLNLLAFRRFRSIAWSGNALAGIVLLTLDALAVFSGGSRAPSLIWLPSVPLIATLLCGVRSGVVWLVLSGLWPGLLLAGERLGLGPIQDFEPEAATWIHMTTLWGIIVCTTLLALIFAQGEKSTQVQLEKARDEALEGSRAKSDFLANMSHEIRTPLNGIIGLTRLLLDTDLSGEQRTDLESVRQSAQSLLDIVNDILDFSKVEAGKLHLESAGFDLREVIREVMENAAAQVDPGLVRVIWSVEASVPRRLLGDRTRVRQIITNLVGNAVKFTREGEVSVEASFQRRETGDGVVAVSVSDTGIGIPADKQRHVFEAFTQADSSTTRLYGGTGLGLSIACALVERMGGELQLESREGEGTTFSFTLPLAEAEEAGEARPPAPLAGEGAAEQPSGLRVLLAEDNRVNQLLARRLLEKDGHCVEVVSNGAEALAQWALKPFDAVVLDVQMPILDGLSASRLIRRYEREARSGRTHIVALTAHALQGYDRRCAEAGMDAYVSKPIDIAALRTALPPEGDRARTAQRLAARGPAPGAESPRLPESLAAPPSSDVPDETLRDQLAEQFREAVPVLLAELRHATRTGSPDSLRAAILTAFAMAAVTGAGDVLETLRRLDQALQNGDGQRVATSLDRLDEELPAAAQADGTARGEAEGG